MMFLQVLQIVAIITWDHTQTRVEYTAKFGPKGSLKDIANPEISANKTTVTLSIDNLIRGVNYEVEITSSSIDTTGESIDKTTTIGFILGNTDSKMSTTSIVLIVIVSIIAVASAITILYIFILKKQHI